MICDVYNFSQLASSVADSILNHTVTVTCNPSSLPWNITDRRWSRYSYKHRYAKTTRGGSLNIAHPAIQIVTIKFIKFRTRTNITDYQRVRRDMKLRHIYMNAFTHTHLGTFKYMNMASHGRLEMKTTKNDNELIVHQQTETNWLAQAPNDDRYAHKHSQYYLPFILHYLLGKAPLMLSYMIHTWKTERYIIHSMKNVSKLRKHFQARAANENEMPTRQQRSNPFSTLSPRRFTKRNIVGDWRSSFKDAGSADKHTQNVYQHERLFERAATQK